MKKWLKWGLCSLLFTCLIMPAIATASEAEIINEVVNAFMKKNQVPGMAVQVYNDGVPNAYYFGYANQEKKIPITGKTIFEVGSISKIMTSLLLAQEVDFAKVQLNTPLKELMKDLPDAFNQVTLLNLATHTSGLPLNTPETVTNRAELEQYLAQASLTYTPEKAWVYSNFGVELLGYALENETQKNVQQLYRNRIFNPLGMRVVGVMRPRRGQSYFAQGYDELGNPVPTADGGSFSSAWGVKVSAEDMQRFLGAAIGVPGTPSRILYPMRMTQAIYVKLANHFQGLGWQIYPLAKTNINYLLANDSHFLAPQPVLDVEKRPYFNGNALIDKTGTTHGFRAYIGVIPNKKSGVVILTNKQVANHEVVNLGRAILFKMTNIMNS